LQQQQPPKIYRIARIISAAILVVVALRHLVLAAQGDGNVMRHWNFVAVNIALAIMLIMKPRWAFWAILAVGAQQMWSHGLDLSQSFLGSAPLDWSSLAVCLFFPTVATILFIERQDEKERSETTGEVVIDDR
jgi:hypothetical protein